MIWPTRSRKPLTDAVKVIRKARQTVNLGMPTIKPIAVEAK